jgi:hypothetical protein
MNEVEAKWEQARDRLTTEVSRCSKVVCRIPRWEPESLEIGLRWLQSSIYEGYYVDFRVQKQDVTATVWFKIWEYGEPEPAWDSIMPERRD